MLHTHNFQEVEASLCNDTTHTVGDECDGICAADVRLRISEDEEFAETNI